MVALELLGLLGKTPRFPARLPQGFTRVLARDKPECREELLALAREVGVPPRLGTALERLERRGRRRQALRSLLETVPGLRSIPAVVDRIRGRRRSPAAVRS
jgi:hypothetical protein